MGIKVRLPVLLLSEETDTEGSKKYRSNNSK